ASVTQGQLLGTVGEDDATYPHLHIEFRKGNFAERCSVHPLRYLPYTDTPNFTAPVLDRFNRFKVEDGSTLITARLRFGASCKLEGDLQGVEVDLMSGSTQLERRFVDFNDKKTIHEGKDDELLFKKDIGVEGYQKSDMVKDGRMDLQYGILIRNIPSNCDTLLARVKEVKGNIATSAPIPVPNQGVMMDENVDFEDGAMPPDDWTPVISTSGAGTTVTNDQCAGRFGSRGMLSIDNSITKSRQRAGIERAMPADRFEWLAEGWFNPIKLNLEFEQAIELLYFRSSGTGLSVAARIFQDRDVLRAGIIVKNPDDTLSPLNSKAIIERDTWRKWKLHVLRIGTRETTAVLSLDDQEELRVNWDSTTFEPRTLRAGIGLSSEGATAVIRTDDLRLTESRDFSEVDDEIEDDCSS
ncbi:MAG TPA: hypothetical protein VLB04_09060, partial [Methanotrichaceae archaeon]|nr:hypothetical protein [Methanotrichaceae archaeon]